MPDDSQGPDADPSAASPQLAAVLESAARLQRLVPDAVLVEGAAAALYAGHGDSTDHDHVLDDLRARFEVVLDALDTDDGWALNRAVPGRIILGRLGGIETGIRQTIRSAPLEVARVTLASGATVRVPTFDETLRVKAFLLVRRNQVRDFLDVAALADRCGPPHAARVLAAIDAVYPDPRRPDEPVVASQLVRQLADPRPRDARTLADLHRYKNLATRWTDWRAVTAVCREVAERMVHP